MASTPDGHFESKSMNAISDLATVNRFATRIEEAEARARGLTLAEARPFVARRIGVAPGTLENIRRLRTKIVPNWLMNRVRSELINVLNSEILRLEHEIAIARQIGADHRDDALASAEAHLAETRKILEGGK